MANTCFNSEGIFGPKKEILELKTIIDSVIADPESDGSLLSILKKVGIDKKYDYAPRENINEPETKYYDYDEEYGYIVFSSESAWTPYPIAWRDILKKIAPNCHYCFVSDESGCDLFMWYDPYGILGPHDYFIDFAVEDLDVIEDEKIRKKIAQHNDTYEVITTSDLIDMLQDILDTNEKDVEKLIEMFEKFKVDNGLENEIMLITEFVEYTDSNC